MRVALAGQRLEFADQGLDQRRLAGAIGTEQADAVAGFEAEAHVTKDRDPLHLLGSLPFKGRAGEGMGFAWLHAMFFTARNPIPTLPSPCRGGFNSGIAANGLVPPQQSLRPPRRRRGPDPHPQSAAAPPRAGP